MANILISAKGFFSSPHHHSLEGEQGNDHKGRSASG
jgi:hypothetical protein